MPFKDDRMRMQREEHGTFSVQLPGIWVGHGYSNEVLAMDAAAGVLTERARRATPALRAQVERLKDELADIEDLKITIGAKIARLELDFESQTASSNAVIDAGYAAIEAYQLDNRYTRLLGPPVLVYVTPWDKNRDGIVGENELEFCYGWGRYNMPESEGDDG